MKKIIYVILLIALIAATVCTVVACNKEDTLTLYVPDGAPALSVAKIIRDGKIGGGSDVGSQPVKTVVTTGEDVIGKCTSGEADMAVLPTNAAVRICSTGNNYVMYSVNVYGVLYVVGRQPIADIKDLVDGQKTTHLYSIGLGNTPEYVFKTVCQANGVDCLEDDGEEHYGKILVKYFADASEIIPLFLSGQADYVLVGEPAATQLIGKLVAQGHTPGTPLDLQKLWKQATNSNEEGYPQASMIVKKSLLTGENSNDFQRRLHSSLSENANFLKQNASDIKGILSSAGSALQVNFTAEILERCNITFVDAYAAKSDIETYLAKFKGMDKFLPLDVTLFASQLPIDE